MTWLCCCGQVNAWFRKRCVGCHHRKGVKVWLITPGKSTRLFFVYSLEKDEGKMPRLDLALTVGVVVVLLPYLLLMIANSARPGYRYEGGKVWYEK